MVKEKLDKAKEVSEPKSPLLPPLREQPKCGWYKATVNGEEATVHVTQVDKVRYFWVTNYTKRKKGIVSRTGSDYVNTWPMRLKSWEMKEIDEAKEEVK